MEDKQQQKNEEMLNELEDNDNMTIDKFIRKYPKEEIVIPIYFTINKGKVIIDYESMQEQFEKELRDILEDVNPEVLK